MYFAEAIVILLVLLVFLRIYLRARSRLAIYLGCIIVSLCIITVAASLDVTPREPGFNVGLSGLAMFVAAFDAVVLFGLSERYPLTTRPRLLALAPSVLFASMIVLTAVFRQTGAFYFSEQETGTFYFARETGEK